MNWAFRVRFEVAERSTLSSESNKLRLTAAAEEPAVYLQPWGDAEGTLREAHEVLLTSQGYASRSDASTAGQAWQSAFQAICVRYQIGVDFGDGSQRSSVGAVPAAQALEEGRVLLADNLGLSVYEDDVPTDFLGFAASGVAVMHSEGELQRGVEKLARARLNLENHVRLACNLFGASFFQPSADARFLLLVMALESLIVEEDHLESVRLHVSELMRQTQESDHLPEDVRRSLSGSLNRLRKESTSQAGKRTVAVLGVKRYDDLEPQKFFTKCYKMRSDMVHGNSKRPNREQIDRWASHLELMVRDLIELQILPDSAA